MRPISRSLSFAGLALGAALIAAACSSAATTPVPADAGSTPGTSVAGVAGVTLASTTDPTLGEYLTGQNGMTLYVLTKDTPDTSSCSGTCATTWPPLVAPSGAMITGPTSATGTFATITRSDGIVQVTYNHMPLYYFSGDSKAGDTTGQGKNGVWFVAPVSGSIPSGGAATSAAPSAAETPAPSTAETPAPSAAASASGY